MATAEQPQKSSEESLPLIRGRRMICPRCKTYHDILEYVPMDQIEEFSDETSPVYKCPDCRWIFSPAPKALEVFRT